MPNTVLSSPTPKIKPPPSPPVSLPLTPSLSPPFPITHRYTAMPSLSRPLSLLLLFVGFFFLLSPSLAKGFNLVPQPVHRSILIEESKARRLTGSFHVCSLCTCCGGPRGLCLPSPCCYAINCNIPNRPFGYCSFTPRTCNCFGCHL